MNYLSLQNSFLKTHTTNSFLSDSSLKNSYHGDTRTQFLENNNQINPNSSNKKIQEVWSKHNFDMNKVKVEQIINFSNVKTTWALEKTQEDKNQTFENSVHCEVEKKDDIKTVDDITTEKEDTSPSHHARRPPNAFLIFCKKHRPIVRQRFPNLENRGVTKILGEWWALLEIHEKQPFNDLAKEYKDAFLSANPNFRWYKLPAPPLRTLTTRPTTISKTFAPLSSPTSPSEFTPGKLADESQLGGLTSLMNNSFSSVPKTECCKNDYKSEDNNNHSVIVEKKYDSTLTNPTNTIKPNLPPKPIKKRIFEQYIDSINCSRNILSDTEQCEQNSNMTNQDLLDKVVDGIFAKQTDDSEKNGKKEIRKSDRMCKGKRYERFMVEGKLLGNKRDTKLTQHKQCKIENKIEGELNSLNKPEAPKLDLDNTIKRLAERTNIKLDFDNQREDISIETKLPERLHCISDSSDTTSKNSPTSNFNLDLRISNLPSLNYDEFLIRKRESKKRKIRTKSESESKTKIPKTDKIEKQPIGSKKRKNKHSITHLNKNEEEISNDLLGLATLAMVAASTEKINEKISE